MRSQLTILFLMAIMGVSAQTLSHLSVVNDSSDGFTIAPDSGTYNFGYGTTVYTWDNSDADQSAQWSSLSREFIQQVSGEDFDVASLAPSQVQVTVGLAGRQWSAQKVPTDKPDVASWFWAGWGLGIVFLILAWKLRLIKYITE